MTGMVAPSLPIPVNIGAIHRTLAITCTLGGGTCGLFIELPFLLAMRNESGTPSSREGAVLYFQFLQQNGKIIFQMMPP